MTKTRNKTSTPTVESEQEIDNENENEEEENEEGPLADGDLLSSPLLTLTLLFRERLNLGYITSLTGRLGKLICRFRIATHLPPLCVNRRVQHVPRSIQ